MNVSPAALTTVDAARLYPPPPTAPPAKEGQTKEVREAFQSFVGETLFGQVLKAMRKTVGKPAYFHGGRAEEIFQAQLDQVLAEKMANASAEKFSEPMFELFAMKRQ
ncbi:MAG: rod-binding protein [Planctomycetota bacterium]